jgi:hypothetical protein
MFYIEARQQDGTLYRGNSLKGIRYGVNRYLQEPPHCKPFDIIKNPEFVESNKIFQTAVQELKVQGFADTKHYEPVTEGDLKKLYSSIHLQPSTPVCLQNKVQFDVGIYFARRGLENMAEMTKDTFCVRTAPSGAKYVERAQGEMQKNHCASDPEEATSGIMPERPGDPLCPVASFERYVSKLNPNSSRLWQYPKDTFTDDDPCWYYNRSIGMNALRGFMPNLSKAAGLSQAYTNHCIRATSATLLSELYCSADIMAVTGHKSAASLVTYQRPTLRRKTQMGYTLGSKLCPGQNDQPANEIAPKQKRLEISQSATLAPAPPTPLSLTLTHFTTNSNQNCSLFHPVTNIITANHIQCR